MKPGSSPSPATPPATPPAPLPAVLRSRQELEARGISFLPAGATVPTSLPIQQDGATYSMAQETAWLDAEHFAVGRWDGSLSIFRFSPGQFVGPLITSIVNSPSAEGVQMITWLTPHTFVSSNDAGSMIVWRSAPDGTWAGLRQAAELSYDASLGEANSGDAFVLGGAHYLVAGHANGYLTIWSSQGNGHHFQFVRSVDVRSAHPVNPWDLHNVRGVSMIHRTDPTALVVTGSEDGDLCVVRVPDGAIISRTVFNPAAQRGINSIATRGQDLLVANCSVGSGDKNLWYYQMDVNTGAIELRDSYDLKVNPSAPQVFNFCTVWGRYQGGVCWFSSTEEGALWMGSVAGGHLSIIGYQPLTDPLGSALAFNTNGKLVMVSYNLYEFITTAAPASATSATETNPERLSED
jgi:hypothetical protein